MFFLRKEKSLHRYSVKKRLLFILQYFHSMTSNSENTKEECCLNKRKYDEN